MYFTNLYLMSIIKIIIQKIKNKLNEEMSSLEAEQN